jgi:hypothetical protein
MLSGALLMVMVSGAVQAERPQAAPVVVDLLPPSCPEQADDADVTVCASRTPDYRIDPGVLAGQRARDGLPSRGDDRERVEAALATSCHALPAKCQGSGIIPLLPVALKAIEAATLAIKGDDWGEAFRTKPDKYQAYQEQRRRPGVRVGVGVSAGSREGPRQ